MTGKRLAANVCGLWLDNKTSLYETFGKEMIRMGSNGFSISDFAKFSRTTRDTLLYYDKIGLLPPDDRGDNNYRYYSAGRLETVNVIRTLRKLGMTLEEIKGLKDHRNPEITIELFKQQDKLINERIEEWNRARKLLLTLMGNIKEISAIDEKVITIQFLPETAVVFGHPNDYSNGRNAYDALLSFYHDMNKKYPELDMNYPVWGCFSGDRIRQGDWVWPDRYYFFNPEGYDKRPAALYAVGYVRGSYGQCGSLYRRLLDYIDKNGFEICGDAYEEYPLNEVHIKENDNYLIRVLIAVREK